MSKRQPDLNSGKCYDCKGGGGGEREEKQVMQRLSNFGPANELYNFSTPQNSRSECKQTGQ